MHDVGRFSINSAIDRMRVVDLPAEGARGAHVAHKPRLDRFPERTVDRAVRIPHPPPDASRRPPNRGPVAPAAREGPLDLMSRAREGASHGSERNALGTAPRAFCYV